MVLERLDFQKIMQPLFVSDVKTSRKHAKTVSFRQTDGSQALFIKSHPNFGIENYPENLDCWATFKAPARSYSQGLMIEVLEGEISGDSYFQLSSDRFTSMMDPGIRREFQVSPGEEDKKIFTIRFHAGGSRDKGFLIKFTVAP